MRLFVRWRVTGTNVACGVSKTNDVVTEFPKCESVTSTDKVTAARAWHK